MNFTGSLSDALEEIIELERKIGIYNVKIGRVSLWRLVRKNCVASVLKRKYQFGSLNERQLNDVNPFRLIKLFFQSLSSLLSLFLSGKSVDSLFFSMQRLQKVNQVFLDKFTDPVIAHGNVGKYLVFQRPLAGKHFSPRYNGGKVFKLDFVHYTAKAFGLILAPFIVLLYHKPITRLKNLYFMNFLRKRRFIWSVAIKLGSFKVESVLYSFLYKRLKVKRIFIVNREINLPAIYSAKKYGIISAEMQHGVTLGPALLYSTQFDSCLDPDYFLTFGEFWKGNHFGMPLEKQINIGFAYSDFLKKNMDHKEELSEYCLVISQPRIGSNIIENVLELADLNENMEFHIRLHPQERLKDSVKQKIDSKINVSLVDNTRESSVVLLEYPYVIGVNSSVLYEALSLGKKVACFNYNDCEAMAVKRIPDRPFFILNSPADFGAVVYGKLNSKQITGDSFYSKFDPDFVKKLE